MVSTKKTKDRPNEKPHYIVDRPGSVMDPRDYLKRTGFEFLDESEVTNSVLANVAVKFYERQPVHAFIQPDRKILLSGIEEAVNKALKEFPILVKKKDLIPLGKGGLEELNAKLREQYVGTVITWQGAREQRDIPTQSTYRRLGFKDQGKYKVLDVEVPPLGLPQFTVKTPSGDEVSYCGYYFGIDDRWDTGLRL